MLVSNKCSATGPVNRTIHIDKSQKERIHVVENFAPREARTMKKDF